MAGKKKHKKDKKPSVKKRLSSTGVPKALDAMGLAESHLMAAICAIDVDACDDEEVGDAVRELHSAIEAVRVAGGKLQDFVVHAKQDKGRQTSWRV